MVKRKLKAGWTRVQARNVRIGEWVTVPDGQRCVIGKQFAGDQYAFVYLVGGVDEVPRDRRSMVVVNYPRP